MAGMQSYGSSDFSCAPLSNLIQTRSAPAQRVCKQSAPRLQDDAHLHLPILPPQGRHARPLRHAAHAVDCAGEGLHAGWCTISTCQ